MGEIASVVNRDELRRLEKAAKEGNKIKLFAWARQFEQQIGKEYEKEVERQLGESIDVFILTIIYTLHFNEKCKFGNKRICDFMEDLFETVDMFKRGEAVPDDYKKQLAEDGIIIKKKRRKVNGYKNF